MAHGKAWMVSAKKCYPACNECMDAYEQYLRNMRIKKGMGTQDKRIDVAKSRERLIELRDVYNISNVEIGRNIGMHNIQVGRIVNGKTSTIYVSKARVLFKYYNTVVSKGQPRLFKDKRYVPVDLTRNALRGLAVQGYSRTWIREQIGIDMNTIWRITMDPRRSKARKKVTRDIEAKVVALAKSVGSSDGGNAYAKAKALQKGWKPTMYYDELV